MRCDGYGVGGWETYLLRDEGVRVFGVFDGVAEFEELVAHLIGECPIFREASLPAGFGELANGGRDFEILFIGNFGELKSEGAKNAVELGEGLGGGGASERRGLAETRENVPERGGGVEVLMECEPGGLENLELGGA